MLKLLQNLLASESERDSSAKTVAIQKTSPNSLESQITQADILWQQGKLGEAIVVYRQAIQQNPESQEIYQHLSALLKQQGNIAQAYEKLATDLKDSGNIEQAAKYYRQAIGIKALTGDTQQKILNPNFVKLRRKNREVAELRSDAFSFQPLSNSSLSKSLNPQHVEEKSPAYSPRKIVENSNSQQTISIDWETAQVYLQQALDLCDEKQWQSAADACRKAIAMVPNMAEAHKILGNALQRLGKTAEAMKCYDRALEIQPDLAEVYAGIGNIYLKQQRWQQAIDYYQKAIIIKPNAQIYRSAAYVWQQLGQSHEVKVNLQKAIKLEGLTSKSELTNQESDSSLHVSPGVGQGKARPNLPPNSIQIYQEIADKLLKQSRWQEAAIYYRKALELSISSPQKNLPPRVDRKMLSASENKSISQQKNLNSKETASLEKSNPIVNRPTPQQQSIIQDLNVLNSKIDRGSPRLKAQESKGKSQIDKAIQRYYRQVELNPNSAIAHCNLGNLYAKKRQWNLAIVCYERAVQLDPKYAAAHLNLARSFARIGRQESFLSEMKIALKLQPNIASAIDRFYLGNALYKSGRPEEAIKSYYKAIVINPYFTQAYHRLGQVLNQQGKEQDATEFYEKAIAYNPKDAELHYALGKQFSQQKNWNAAVKIYGKVLELEPRFPNASTQLNLALAEKLKLDLANKRK